MNGFTTRPSDVLAAHYRAAGTWRDSGPMDDLIRWRDETPDAPALWECRGGAPARRISFARFADSVERFAGALYELGIRPGDVIALQLPNRWETAALMLATARLSAVLVPIMTDVRPGQLEEILARTRARVCVTMNRWLGFDQAGALREMAPRLPQLQHRVILGQASEAEIDFSSFFANTRWERHHPEAAFDSDPDRISVILFTSGVSAAPKGVLHSWNTLHASAAGWAGTEKLGRHDVIFTPHQLMHAMGSLAFLAALEAGASAVLLDSWSGDGGLHRLAVTGTTVFTAAPAYFSDMLTASGGKPQHLPALRTLFCGMAPVSRQLVHDVPLTFGLPLRSTWVTAEVGIGAWSRIDDPIDWAARSDGRPSDVVELDLRSDTEITWERPARLFARGAGVCLATMDRDTGHLTVVADQNDGWCNTEDLAIPDSRGGIRLIGRSLDQTGSVFRIPVAYVESKISEHPGVADVALVRYLDARGQQMVCAVVQPTTWPPVSSEELRMYLFHHGMATWCIPSRVELFAQLPRDREDGRVRKDALRRWLQGQSMLDDASVARNEAL